MNQLFKSRFALFFSSISIYILLSFLVRVTLYSLSLSSISFSAVNLIRIFFTGFAFDCGIAIFFNLVYLIYLLAVPKKLIGSLFDKIATYFIVGITTFVMLFSFAAEFPFWDEFNVRFNFIAVDYLIYTYEVIGNINQSYPIPLILVGLFTIIAALFFILKKKNILAKTFNTKVSISKRLTTALPLLALGGLFLNFASNKQAEWSENVYENELSKNGTFSFFAAFRANELDYQLFYPTIDRATAYKTIKKELLEQGDTYTNNKEDNLERLILNDGITKTKPNIILVTIESFSADFLKAFGNTNNLTPNYEKLANESIFFTNMYATGTRTVRGMEALTLCVPPTPGNSIVRRPNNDNLYSIGSILKQEGYDLKFVYGGDGYFDNMNSFFGGQGFDIVDRNRGNPLADKIKTTRYKIEDKDVTFENAWGICDEDIYKQSLKYATAEFEKKKPFFQFIMTTSNHKPYTYPNNKIDLPQGSRDGAVKYTDYALGKFIESAKTQPWFKNTVFVIVADHCASSAGKWEINVDKHHIPAIIYNANKATKVDKICSQIDLMPTLFSTLGWNYKTQLYGKNIFKLTPNEQRALIGNYRTLGLLKPNVFIEINDRKQVNQYQWDGKNSNLTLQPKPTDSLKNLVISYYQTVSERYKSGKMKITK